MSVEDIAVGQWRQLAEELQSSGLVGGCQPLQEQASEQARQHADGQEEARPAGHPAVSIEGDPAAGHDHMDMRVMGKRRTPRVQHRGHADTGAEMLRIGGNGDQRLAGGLEQGVVDDGLIVVGDIPDERRHGEHHVIVRHVEELVLSGREPVPGRLALALGAMPVAARVVGNKLVGAVLAAFHMAAECGSAQRLT